MSSWTLVIVRFSGISGQPANFHYRPLVHPHVSAHLPDDGEWSRNDTHHICRSTCILKCMHVGLNAQEMNWNWLYFSVYSISVLILCICLGLSWCTFLRWVHKCFRLEVTWCWNRLNSFVQEQSNENVWRWGKKCNLWFSALGDEMWIKPYWEKARVPVVELITYCLIFTFIFCYTQEQNIEMCFKSFLPRHVSNESCVYLNTETPAAL